MPLTPALRSPAGRPLAPPHAARSAATAQAATIAARPTRTHSSSPHDRFVRAAYYVNALPEPANRDTGVAYIMSVMRNVSVPFGASEPGRPNVANTIFRSVIDVTGQRYFFESTFAPNVVWIDYSGIDFGEGRPEMQLAVERDIFSLTGDVTDRLQPVSRPFEFRTSS